MNHKAKRIIMSVLGMSILGFCVALLRKAEFGTDPFTCAIVGIANLFHSNYGVAYPIVIIVLLILVFILDKHYLGLGTIINLFCVGTVGEISFNLLNKLYDADTIVIRGITFAVAIVLLCFATSIYIVADLGVSSYDAMSLIMADKKIAKYRFCRIGTDVLCVIIGFVLGATTDIGVGTVITALFMGPIVQLFIDHVATKILPPSETK